MNFQAINFIKAMKDFLFVMLGICFASVGLKAFLMPNGFFDGGVIGGALLLKHFVDLELSYLILVLNLPFILIAVRQISVSFAIKSALAIFALAIVVHYLEIPVVTQDKFLISIFGGVFIGAGIGLAIRGGAVIDGTEILAVQISRKTSLSVGDFIAILNFVLFTLVAALINLEMAMYSMLTYVAASKSVDFILSGIEEYIGVTIVSNKQKELRQILTQDLRRAVTVYRTEGGYSEAAGLDEGRALFCVVTRLEVAEILNEVAKIDPQAFVLQHSIKDISGGMIKRRPLQSLVH